jgi:hypothetical protein
MNLKERLAKASVTAKEERQAILMGDFNAVVDKVTAKTFKSGSFGYVFVYAITDKEGKGRKVFENIVLTKADNTPVEYGDDRLLRRLFTLGIGDDKLGTFQLPEVDSEIGDLPKLNGIKVIISLERKLNSSTGVAEQNLKKVELAKSQSKAA